MRNLLMPRVTDYPLSSMKIALDTAASVDKAGGDCVRGTLAEMLNMSSKSGSFRSRVSSAIKFGFLTKSGNNIANTELFKKIKLAYDEEEKEKFLTEAFYSIPLFVELINRFEGKSIPSKNLKKILIREFGVADSLASRVAGYFIDGIQSINLLDNQNRILTKGKTTTNDIEIENGVPPSSISSNNQTTHVSNQVKDDSKAVFKKDEETYSIHIVGPDVDASMIIGEEDDLVIINAYLNKIKKRLSSSNENEKKEGG